MTEPITKEELDEWEQWTCPHCAYHIDGCAHLDQLINEVHRLRAETKQLTTELNFGTVLLDKANEALSGTQSKFRLLSLLGQASEMLDSRDPIEGWQARRNQLQAEIKEALNGD